MLRNFSRDREYSLGQDLRDGVRRVLELDYRLWAATGVLVLLLGFCAVTPAGASGLSIGANSTVKLGDALLALGCNDLTIETAGTLQAQPARSAWLGTGTIRARSTPAPARCSSRMAAFRISRTSPAPARSST